MNISDAARYLIHLSHKSGVSKLTPLKLQKLLYLAQGWHFRWTASQLFNDCFEAWDYGPVNSSIYQTYKVYGREVIPAFEGSVPNSMNQEEKQTLDSIWNIYGNYAASRLISLTHEQSPWREAYGHGGIISNESIRDYFLSAY